jgi:transposase
VTRRLAESVSRPCQVASILHVAHFFTLDWKTVKDLDGLEVIAMGEFAIQKRHRYATVIVEPTRNR